MATKIVTKNSSTASAVPTASDLVQGELAVNVADKRLFTEDNGGSIVELGTNPSTIDINAGSIDGTAIGASSASTGAFTTLTASGLTVDTNTLYVDSTNNRVGIGTTSPASTFEIAKNDQTNGATLSITNSSNSSGWDAGDIIGSIDFRTDDTSTTQPIRGQIKLFEDSASGTTYANSNAMSFSTGSNDTLNERMRIDSSGNLLVGLTSTSGIATGSTADNGVYVDGSVGAVVAQSSANKNLYCSKASGYSDPDFISFQVNGSSVGSIGTVSGDIRIGGLDDNHASIRFAASSKAVLPVKNSDGGLSDATTDLGASNARFKALYLSGGVNIGNGSVATGGDNYVYSYSGGSNGQVRSGIKLEGSTNTLEFYTGQSERARIDSSGNVGVGTTSPQEMIHAYSGSTSAAIRASGNGNNNSKVEIGYHTTNGPYIKAGSSGVTKLQVYVDNTSLAAEFRSNGDFYSNDGTVHSLSDSRVKKDIADLTDGLDLVKQLRPRTFKFNGKATTLDDDRTRYGFVADEVMAVASQYVSLETQTIDDVEVDDFKSLSTTKMIPMLVKAIQEQQTLIESLTARIAALEE